jgi:hypothetical protein
LVGECCHYVEQVSEIDAAISLFRKARPQSTGIFSGYAQPRSSEITN